MSNVIYSKCSTERDDKFKIITSILEEKDKRTVIKRAACETAYPHIRLMLEAYNGLVDMYKDTPISVLKGNSIKEGIVEFPYVEGENFENLLQKTIAEENEEKVLELIGKFADIFYQNSNVTVFCSTPQFEVMFGQQSFKNDKAALPISNLDSIFENYIICGNKMVLVDYEWTFDFLIPIEFILFRTLFHSAAIQRLSKKNMDKAYEIARIEKNDCEQYLLMENNFQKYVKGNQIDLDEIYNKLNMYCYSLKLFDEKKLLSDYELYYDDTCVFKSYSYQLDIEIKQNVPDNIKKIRCVLNHYNGIYKILKVVGIKNGIEMKLDIADSNSDLVIIDDYYFLNQPEIIIENEGLESIFIQYKIIEQNISCMNQMITALKQSEQYKKEMEEYKKEMEEYKKGMEEYMTAYHTLENEIKKIHETTTWKIGEKIAKFTKK